MLIDHVGARVVASLDATARRRLERTITESGRPGAARLFEAGACEMNGAARHVVLRVRKGRLAAEIHLGATATYENHALRISSEVPDTILSAMRGRPVVQIAAHPLLEGLVASSARRQEGQGGGETVVETRRAPDVDMRDIPVAANRPIDLLEVLETLGAKSTCRVAATICEWMSTDQRTALALRLGSGATPPCARATDLMPWRPRGVEHVRLEIGNGILHAGLSMTTGSYRDMRLSLYGSPRSISNTLSGGLFWAHRGRTLLEYHRTLADPTITLDELRNRLHKAKDAA